MKWVYDLCGAEPIIKDLPVYDATNIAQGELLQQSLADANLTMSSGSGGFSTAATTTVGATIGLNAIGISLEAKTTADVPSIAAAHSLTTGAFCYAKVIVNPFAVYRAQVDTAIASTGSAHPLTIVAAGSSQTLQFSLASSTPTGQFDGSWVYFCASAGPNFGALRKIATSASAGTMIADAALTSVTSADRCVILAGVGHRPNGIDADSLYTANCSVTAETCTNFRIVENWIESNTGVARLIESAHAGGRFQTPGTAQAKLTKLYQDIVCSDHIFGTS